MASSHTAGGVGLAATSAGPTLGGATGAGAAGRAASGGAGVSEGGGAGGAAGSRGSVAGAPAWGARGCGGGTGEGGMGSSFLELVGQGATLTTSSTQWRAWPGRTIIRSDAVGKTPMNSSKPAPSCRRGRSWLSTEVAGVGD